MRFNALITFFSVTRARHLITKTICTKLGAREWLNLEQGTGYAIDGILRLQQSIGALFSIQKPALAYHDPVKSFFNLKLMISSTWRPQSRFSNSILCIMFYKKWLKLFHFKVTVLSWHWANFINNFLPVVRRRLLFSSLFLQGRKFTAAVNEIKDHCTYDRFLFPNLLSSLKNVANQFVTC